MERRDGYDDDQPPPALRSRVKSVERLRPVDFERSKVKFNVESEWNQSVGFLRHWLVNNVTFFWLHYSYFVLIGLIGGIFTFYIEDDVPFVDCLFNAYSACCVTGLSTADFSKYKIGSQVVIFVLIGLGGQVMMSSIVPSIRRAYFREGLRHSLQTPHPKAHRKQAEYRALGYVRTLALSIYFGFNMLSFVLLGIYLTATDSRRHLCEKNGVNTWWFALFHSFSSFNNAGFAPFADNLIQFQDDYFFLLWTTVLILAGNTGFPVLMRLSAWFLHKIWPDDPGIKFLLVNPRRCSTHVFPAFHTRIILSTIIFFTIFEFVAFMSLEFNEENKFLPGTPDHIKVLIGWFQSISTRTAGFNVIDLSVVAPSVQFLYCVLMYLTSYPVIAAIRRASESREVKVHKGNISEVDEDIGSNEPTQRRPWNQVKQSILADSWLLVLAVFAICAAQDKLITKDDYVDIFRILFEISSAYGTVGLSIGYPGTVVSFSGKLNTFSKLVICIVMLGGRHRGLPRSIDRAVSLPTLFNVKKNKKKKRANSMNDVNRSSFEMLASLQSTGAKVMEKIRTPMRRPKGIDTPSSEDTLAVARPAADSGHSHGTQHYQPHAHANLPPLLQRHASDPTFAHSHHAISPELSGASPSDDISIEIEMQDFRLPHRDDEDTSQEQKGRDKSSKLLSPEPIPDFDLGSSLSAKSVGRRLTLHGMFHPKGSDPGHLEDEASSSSLHRLHHIQPASQPNSRAGSPTRGPLPKPIVRMRSFDKLREHSFLPSLPTSPLQRVIGTGDDDGDGEKQRAMR